MQNITTHHRAHLQWVITLLLLLSCYEPAMAQSANARQAREMFDRSYKMVFGQEGCTLHYDVNLVGIYKTSGSIWMKGDKSKFVESRYLAWNNGKNHYLVDTKKKTVTLFDAASDKKDKYSGKFKFSPDDFNYSMERTAEDIIITMKQRKDAKGTVKEAKATIDAKTLAPKHVKVKVAFIWANIWISNFKAGGITDNIFVFPRSRYGSDYKYIDKR